MCLPDDEKTDVFFSSDVVRRGQDAQAFQINSIERSLIVPLRPARKLKLTME